MFIIRKCSLHNPTRQPICFQALLPSQNTFPFCFITSETHSDTAGTGKKVLFPLCNQSLVILTTNSIEANHPPQGDSQKFSKVVFDQRSNSGILCTECCVPDPRQNFLQTDQTCPVTAPGNLCLCLLCMEMHWTRNKAGELAFS